MRKMAKVGRNKDGTWNHAALKVEHGALINAGSIAPTRMLAARYDVSETLIRKVLAENPAIDTSRDAIPNIHDPFGHCTVSASPK